MSLFDIVISYSWIVLMFGIGCGLLYSIVYIFPAQLKKFLRNNRAVQRWLSK